MTDITNLIVSIAGLLIAVMTTFGIPLIKAKIGEAKFNEIYKWVVVAVKAAEQAAKNGSISLDDRKQTVVQFLEKKGYKLDWDELDKLIEAAVNELPPTVVKESE